jgi:hypothetical protein
MVIVLTTTILSQTLFWGVNDIEITLVSCPDQCVTCNQAPPVNDAPSCLGYSLVDSAWMGQ